MKRVALGCLALLVGATAAFAQAQAKAQDVPEIPYESVPNFFKMPPNIYFGEGIGVATNSKGHVYVYTRSGETRLFEFDQNGNYVREIGAGNYGFAFAHAVRVDAQDNEWAVDEGTNMIVKFNPLGRVIMTLGRRPEAVEQFGDIPGQGGYTGANKPYSFSRETDVAWDKDGNIFVSDGYGDSRVVKYDKNGRFIKSDGEIYKLELDGRIVGKFGRAGKLPKEFGTVNAIDCRSENDLYVGELLNWRVQKLTLKR